MDTALETCGRCGATLSQDAKFCSQCGQSVVPEVSSPKLEQKSSRQAIGPTRFFFRRTSSEIVVKAAVTNEAAQVFAETIQSLTADKLLRVPRLGDIASDEEQGDPPIETSAVLRPGIEAPTEPAEPSVPTVADSDITDIFGMENGVPRLKQHFLKAGTQTEYARRLIRMFLYYMQRYGGMSAGVPRSDLYKFLNGIGGISGDTYRPLISDGSITKVKDATTKKGNDTLCLTFAGEQQVRQYLEEIANPDAEDGWWPGKVGRAPAPKKRRTNKRATDAKEIEGSVAQVWSEEVQQVRELVKSRHEEIAKWQPADLVLLGLYTIRKMQGEDADASYVKVRDTLYSAFELSMPDRRIRRALEATKKSQDNYVNPGSKGRGFRISPTGVRRVEDLLNLKQFAPVLTATGESESANGASQE